MKEDKKIQIFYLDENHNFVDEKYAVKTVIRILDADGNLVQEVWGVPKDTMRFCPFCGEELSGQTESCLKCGRNHAQLKTDLELTIQFCTKCGRDVPMLALFCPYCGEKTRDYFGNQSDEDDTIIDCVYASPEWLLKQNKKESIFSKLFRRKK